MYASLQTADVEGKGNVAIVSSGISVVCPILILADALSMSRRQRRHKQYPQTKLVRVIKGTVYDVAVDLRANSPTYGKYHGELLRLCGIIHCIKCALNDVNPVENRVTLETFCNAIEIGEYFREQAIYAYSLGDVDLGTIKAERVLNKIRSKHITSIRQNDLYKLCRCTLFKNAADFAETMEMLEEYNYIVRTTSKGANNKTMIDVIVNPNIYR